MNDGVEPAAKRHCTKCDNEGCRAEISALRNENERLRAELAVSRSGKTRAHAALNVALNVALHRAQLNTTEAGDLVNCYLL